ncbi:MAG: transposase [Pseudomonadota bacterium]|nr:transposase [Pseudomonadota bacterium]
MASPKLHRGRHSLVGAYYTVTAVARDRQPFLTGALPARALSDELRISADEGATEPIAWVIMPDHIHWLFRLRQGSLGSCVQRFKSRSARSVNVACNSKGTVWQAGYYDHRLRDEEDLATQARYIIANPVRRGLVQRIEAYPHWRCRWDMG